MGSRVIRGNLLVIPIDDALLYVRAIFVPSRGAGTGVSSLPPEIVLSPRMLNGLFAALFVQEPKPPAGAASTPDRAQGGVSAEA
jgi:hypothetical protein